MPEVITYVGLPRSGKTTHIKKEYGHKVISSFDITNKSWFLFDDLNKENTKIINDLVKTVFEYIMKKYNISDNTNERDYDKYFILSADDIRMSLYKEAYIHTLEPFVWSVRNIILTYLLKNDYNIIIDETNLTEDRRNNLFCILNELRRNYTKLCVFVNTPLDKIIKRIPEKYFQDMVKIKATYLTEPKLTEGFDNIEKIY